MPEAHAEKRVALVVGNAAYQNTPRLTNPVNDADDLADVLKVVGFAVTLERDLDKRGMERAIVQFARDARDADAALFYYAGHGLQHRGLNYLMPTDARLDDEFSLNFEMARLEDIVLSLGQARGVKILVLDACRRNPLVDRLAGVATTRDFVTTRGLARFDATRGMVVAYATQADQVAGDGTERNSPFTAALVKRIKEPGLEIGTLFRRVAADVNRVTRGRQLPELSVSLLGEFYFSPADSDVQAWAKVRASKDPAELRRFIARYASSPLATDARERLEAIEGNDQARIEHIASDSSASKKTEPTAPEENMQTVMLTPAPKPAPAAPAQQSVSRAALITDIKKELKRVGCYAGRIDDNWAGRETQSSVRKFVKFAKFSTAPAEPEVELLEAIRDQLDRVCPLECDALEVEKDGRCAAKTCRNGFMLGDDGSCRKQKNIAKKPPRPSERSEPEKSASRAPVRRTIQPVKSTSGTVWRADHAYSAGTYRNCMGARTGCYERSIAGGKTPEQARAWCGRVPTC
jgi:hypothetical protein